MNDSRAVGKGLDGRDLDRSRALKRSGRRDHLGDWMTVPQPSPAG
ncbi:MAG: hypothetical protein ACO4AI_05385 [Prochlorothrix sp.]|nr:hypothetical protein [Prochlorothrix sp.]